MEIKINSVLNVKMEMEIVKTILGITFTVGGFFNATYDLTEQFYVLQNLKI